MGLIYKYLWHHRREEKPLRGLAVLFKCIRTQIPHPARQNKQKLRYMCALWCNLPKSYVCLYLLTKVTA